MNSDKLDDLQKGLKQLPGIGAKTGLKLIQKHQNLENIIKEKLEIRKNKVNDFISQDLVKQIRAIFLSPNVKTDIPKLRWKAPNLDLIREILCEAHNFNVARINSGLEQIEKKVKSTQTTLGDFM